MDFVIVDSKLQMMNNSTSFIFGQIHQLTRIYSEKKTSLKKLVNDKNTTWFIVECNTKQDSIVLFPTREQIKKMFEEIVLKCV